MAQSYLIPGVDLVSLPCITASDVQQAIAAAVIRSPYGLNVVSDDAPDVVSTPELARFIWLRSIGGVSTGEFYYYNGSTWTLLSIVNGNLLADNTVPLSKLKLTGSSAFDIIQVNSLNTALQFISVVNAIQNGSVPVNKLVAGGAAHVLVSLANINQFVPLAGIAQYLSPSSIPITTIQGGGPSAHGLFLRTFETGSPVEWADFDPNEQIDDGELNLAKLDNVIDATVLGGGQSFRRNSANSEWEPFTPLTVTPPKKYAQLMDRRAVNTPPEAIVLGSSPATPAWTVKQIQTVQYNVDGLIVSLVGNQFVLQAGTFDINIVINVAQAFARLRLYNVTGAVPLIQGVNTRSRNNTAALVLLSGRITVAAAQTLELQYSAINDGGGASALGYPQNTVDDEIYAVIDIKEA